MINNRILAALRSIPVAQLDRDGWLKTGMALKEEGFDVSVWDEWSRDDERYHEGECQRLWDSFNGAASPVTGGTIIRMAQGYGWMMPSQPEELAWDAVIKYDGDTDIEDISTLPNTDFSALAEPPVWDPVAQVKLYLQLLFRPDEYVAYATNDYYYDENDGKYRPLSGSYSRTAGELIAELDKHPDDLGAVIGDWHPEAGAWIQFNPVDGKGVSRDHVTSFRYSLLECDSIPKDEQIRLFRTHQFPIKVMVDSGGKSVHAIIMIDADNRAEYDERVRYLYLYCEKHSIPVDGQNKNPSRKSRLPGVTRNGNKQYIIDTNMGKRSWADWVSFVEGEEDDNDLPPIVYLSDYNCPPERSPELIQGILRKGHKMIISGGSKAGKSILLMELCCCIAEGIPWLGFNCSRGKVLYINLEIDEKSCITRFFDIYNSLGMDRDRFYNIAIWNLRGRASTLDKLMPSIINRTKDRNFDLIIVDPIYKIITGDENNATAMAQFTNYFDTICTDTGCSVVYAHHHSKGAQGGKKAMDRASGSGVFARDADALLDMTELDLSDDILFDDQDTKAYRVESTLREFPNITPVNVWFQYPLHKLDDTGTLANMLPEGADQSAKRNKVDRAEQLRNAYEACRAYGNVTVADLHERLNLSEKTIYERIKNSNGEFYLGTGMNKGFVFRS